MPINGESVRAVNGTYKKYDFIYPEPIQIWLETPVSLPTTEPSSGATIYSFTITEDMLPHTVPQEVSMEYYVNCFAGVRNDSGTTANGSVRVSVNGVSRASTVQSVNNANYATFNMHQNCKVVLGDVVQIKVWGATANMTLNFIGLAICPSRVQLAKDGRWLSDITFTINGEYPTFTVGLTPTKMQTNGIITYTHDVQLTSIAITTSYPILVQGEIYKVGRWAYGDYASSTNRQQNTTSCPRYYAGKKIDSIEFRPALEL